MKCVIIAGTSENVSSSITVQATNKLIDLTTEPMEKEGKNS
jgi:hypothetical protein